MNLKNRCQKITKWILTFASVFTMVMLPVAHGEAAQKDHAEISKAQVQNAITQLGLNKSMTLGEFYKKNKDLYPQRIQAQLEKFIKNNSDYVMPLFELTTVKSSDGQETPTLRISKDGELVNIQVYGQADKYLKFNNTNLTQVDIVNFNDMFLKLTNNDANLRKQVVKSEAPSTKFNGYPQVSKEIWSKMSTKDKAEYLLNMRWLWSDAQKVLILQDKKNQKTTSQFEYFWNAIFNKSEAQSAGVKPAGKRVRQDVKKDSGTTAEASSENCLVAGYVSSYTNGSCGVKALQDSYKDDSGVVNPAVSKAQAQCQPGQIACNPFVYGMPGGNAICVSTSSPKFQIATHADGPCDTASPLGQKVDFLNKDLKNKDRYSAENLSKNSDQLAEEYKKQQAANSSYVENYLKGFLGAGVDLSKELDSTVLDQIVNIKKAFDNDIQKAKDSCLAAASSNKYNEKNFWGACDQLQRRFLFVAEFLKEKPGCKDGGTINSSTLKCTCADPKQTEVNPGAKCPVKEPSSTDSTVQKCPQGMSDDSTGGELQCLCTNGAAGNWKLEDTKVSGFDVKKSCAKSAVTSGDSTPMKPGDKCDGTIVKNDNGAEACVAKPTDSKTKPKKDDGFFGSFSGFFQKALPWIVGGVAVWAMYTLWAPKKPQIKSPGDACPANSTPTGNSAAPCSQTCTAPLSNVNGTCMCPSCPTGQTLTNLSTCVCSTNTTTPTQTTCADGVTKVTPPATCPVTAQFKCWDGTYVVNAINCPEKPPTQKITPAVQTGH